MQAYQSITGDSPGPTNRYLLKVKPGVYYIGSTQLSMIDSVDIEGSGENITFITGDGMLLKRWDGHQSRDAEDAQPYDRKYRHRSGFPL